MSRTSEIGLSRKQKVFACLETVMGTLKFPNATFDFIRPVGNAVVNQNPAFANSEELADTLDLLDQFQNATPAGDFTLAMYLRPSGTLGTATPPQGSVLFRSLQGSVNAATTASITSLMSASAATLILKAIAGGTLPQVGVILAGTEKIYYTGRSTYVDNATIATLTGCTRGYGATTATAHAADVQVSLNSIFYKQETTSPSFSLWVETDHIVQALSGCSVNSAVLEISNEGGVKITFTGQGMQMKWAGTDALVTGYATTATQFVVTDSKRFCVGMWIHNETKSGGPKKIATITSASHTIGLGTATLGITWATADVIKGYTPSGTIIGDPIESKDTAAYLEGVLTKIKTGSLNIGTPKQYLTDEVGTEYPEDYLENVRDINSSLNLYFRKSAIAYFKDGYDGNEAEVRMTFGEDAGKIMEICMPRCKLTIPAIAFAPPAIELNIPITALGTFGEDSLEIIFR